MKSFKYHTRQSAWRKKVPDALFTHGWGNGYIKIPRGHWLHGMIYYNIEELSPPFLVHGGITYSNTEGDYWVLGFDTAHYNSDPKVWTKEKVEEHTKAWARAFYNWDDPRELVNENSGLNSWEHCEVCGQTQGVCRC